ncbi:MAG: flavodoxin [Anaeroplasma sp.]
MNKKVIALLISILIVLAVGITIFALTNNNKVKNETNNPAQANNEQERSDNMNTTEGTDGLILIKGGTFEMGSPETEAQREQDEMQHKVTLNDFYIGKYEITQKEYQEIMGENPSNFKGEDLPVENITWYDAIEYCNRLSEKQGLTPVYTINGENVTWNRANNGYRLPTEAEWEYSARAGTTTPFNTENSISADEANFYGHYPYGIEENYFSQSNLETKPGEYRQTTTKVGSFSPNKWGLYDIHGNVREWCFDYYGEYDTQNTDNPSGVTTGSLRINRGGSWNDYAKHMRSAYRSSLAPNQKMNNTGFRIARNVDNTSSNEIVENTNKNLAQTQNDNQKALIVYFSWSGNTEGAAQIIQEKTGADLFELELVNPYSSNYNKVLDEAQRDLNSNARPELKNKVENIEQYDVIMLGYPNWWATIPMPVATFLEEYDLSEKTILPFCSHGGGEFGQSISDISKLAPNSKIGEGLSIHYSGGSTLSNDISNWLSKNGISER